MIGTAPNNPADGSWGAWEQIGMWDQYENLNSHQHEERRTGFKKNKGTKWQFRCVSCKRFVGMKVTAYCHNVKCEVPILLELSGMQREKEEPDD